MYELIFQNYLNNLTKNDILTFGIQNNIKLNSNELEYIYKTLKNNYKFLLGNDYEIVFKEAKNYLTKSNYDKIFSLYLSYREKYQDFLN